MIQTGPTLTTLKDDATYGKAMPTYLASSSQNGTSHARPFAGLNAAAVGRVVGFAVLNRPQYAIAELATTVIGIP